MIFKKKLTEGILPWKNYPENSPRVEEIWDITDTIFVTNYGATYQVCDSSKGNERIFTTKNIEELNTYLNDNYGVTIEDPDPMPEPEPVAPKKKYPLYIYRALEKTVAAMTEIPDEQKEEFISLVGDRCTEKKVPRAGWKSARLPAAIIRKYPDVKIGGSDNYRSFCYFGDDLDGKNCVGLTLKEALLEIYEAMKNKWFKSVNETLVVNYPVKEVSAEKKQLFKFIDDLSFYVDKDNLPLVDETLAKMIQFRRTMTESAHLNESLSDKAKELILDECGYQLEFGGSDEDLLEDILDILTYNKETFDKADVIDYMNKCLSGEIKKPRAAITVAVDFDNKFATSKLEDMNPANTMTVGDIVEYLDVEFDSEDMIVFKSNDNTYAPVTGGCFKKVSNIYAKETFESLNLDESVNKDSLVKVLQQALNTACKNKQVNSCPYVHVDEDDSEIIIVDTGTFSPEGFDEVIRSVLDMRSDIEYEIETYGQIIEITVR